uniref:CIV iridoviral protein homologue n=1 Tax=Diadromus pulchellus ascovirus 4a TaxID=158683 RepID=Q9DSW1_9VIRU|nr:CIV iridoviral protein homologue [Diadromus pulchellus ascovirus 4a]
MEAKLKNILKLGVTEEVANSVVANNSKIFAAAFTTADYDPKFNYEFFEQLGDLTINKFIVSYMSRRFPQLRNRNGVNVLATLRISYGSKNVLSGLSSKYGLDKLVRMTREESLDKTKSRLSVFEDVFEALFGAIEFVFDRDNFPGMGYVFCYRILTAMFDDLDVKIDYESLVDAKTRLNELKAEHKFSLTYRDSRDEASGMFRSTAVIDASRRGRARATLRRARRSRRRSARSTGSGVRAASPRRCRNVPGARRLQLVNKNIFYYYTSLAMFNLKADFQI